MRLLSLSFAGLLSACGGGAAVTAGSAGFPATAGEAGTTMTTSGGSGSEPVGGGGTPAATGGTALGGSGAVAEGGTGAAAGSGEISLGGTAGATGGSGGSAGHGPPDPALPPGQNFDLSRFALQLPIANGNSVLQIKDLASYTSDYFFTGTDAGMVFWCPVTGATTPNSHYPRTELRELPDGGDWAITGHHRLTASFKMLQNTPSKGTIIGQIHGNATDGTSEVLKLEWMSNDDIVASVEQNDSPSQQIDHKMGSGYKRGELVSYDFELKDAMLTVTVTDTRGTQSFTTPYTAASWTQDKYYFKLGTYVQLDTGGSTVGGKVAFYSLSIEHG